MRWLPIVIYLLSSVFLSYVILGYPVLLGFSGPVLTQNPFIKGTFSLLLRW